jgi:hypothetical protein
MAERRADAVEAINARGANIAGAPTKADGMVEAKDNRAMRHRRNRIKEVRDEFHVLSQVDPAEAGHSGVVMHMHMEEPDILRAAVVSAPQGFADRGGPHHGSDPRIFEIVAVFNAMVASGQDHQPVIAQPACAAEKKPDTLGGEGMRPVQVIPDFLEKIGSGTEQRHHA